MSNDVKWLFHMRWLTFDNSLVDQFQIQFLSRHTLEKVRYKWNTKPAGIDVIVQYNYSKLY